MAAGLQTFNASGVLTLQIDDRVTRIIGRITTRAVNGTPGDLNDFYSVPDFGLGVGWVAMIDPTGTLEFAQADTAPYIQMASNGFYVQNFYQPDGPGTFVYGSSVVRAVDIIYGVY